MPTPHPLSGGCGGLTFVAEPSLPAGFALAEVVAHEVLAHLGPLLTAGVWRALVRQVWDERKEETVVSCSRPAEGGGGAVMVGRSTASGAHWPQAGALWGRS